MGVAGSGKTTLAKAIAQSTGRAFFEGDDLHLATSVAKMRAGEPLNDDDRWPWLDAIAAHLNAWDAGGQPGVLSCSALKAAYRDHLRAEGAKFRLVYQALTPELALARVGDRPGHYFPPSLVTSQFEALEEPTDRENPIRLDASANLETNVETVIRKLSLQHI